MNTKKIVAALLLSSSLASAVSASAAYSAMAKYKKASHPHLVMPFDNAGSSGRLYQQLLFYPRNHLWNLYLWRSRISKDFSSRPK